MLKTPRAPVRGFTPQVRRATPGTAQQVAKDTASSGLEESRGHSEHVRSTQLWPAAQARNSEPASPSTEGDGTFFPVVGSPSETVKKLKEEVDPLALICRSLSLISSYKVEGRA